MRVSRQGSGFNPGLEFQTGYSLEFGFQDKVGVSDLFFHIRVSVST